ncbi:hypothetical protein A3H16_04045 [Candidatus Kaiserbacteria bacterium RIFCSPLOWO2_12_FULL_53_8]|uniref:RNA polymerase sigma factor 70 region 4 type 2 domain-containing protein n=1 Tax=Candidatus Kaiserbacteria bacterium RIFCSPLOWO2_12_FULL_53_8 TaxID=1798529 RepID=A0A1F6G2Q8_9BACT|nr:MAG: hypothetical protein A3H16_04045 [Candidatus Kaiserbacteria bacterium RIFCSPLOWO2_12_FULL_53_8]
MKNEYAEWVVVWYSNVPASKKPMENPSQQQEGEKAFLAAYDEFGDAIFRFLTMKISDREIARDLTQETFTRAWDFCVQGGEIREWRPFLYRTAYNLVVDTYRKKRAVSLDAMIDDQGFAVSDDSAHEKRTIVRAEMSRVRKGIDQLDETYRDIVLMRYTEDLPPKDIARITGLSENVVSVRLHRGVEKLRTILGPDKKQI